MFTDILRLQALKDFSLTPNFSMRCSRLPRFQASSFSGVLLHLLSWVVGCWRWLVHHLRGSPSRERGTSSVTHRWGRNISHCCSTDSILVVVHVVKLIRGSQHSQSHHTVVSCVSSGSSQGKLRSHVQGSRAELAKHSLIFRCNISWLSNLGIDWLLTIALLCGTITRGHRGIAWSPSGHPPLHCLHSSGIVFLIPVFQILIGCHCSQCSHLGFRSHVPDMVARVHRPNLCFCRLAAFAAAARRAD